MYLSLHPSLIGKTSYHWNEMAQIAAKSGFAAIDVDITQLSQAQVANFEECLASLGIRVGGLPLPVDFRHDEAAFERDFASLPERAGLAAQIGATVMCRALPASSDYRKRDFLTTIRRRLRACAAVLADYHLNLGLEFMGPLHMRTRFKHEFVWQFNETLEIAASCGPNVGMLLDAWHWHHSGASISDIWGAGDRIFHVQVADSSNLLPEAVRDDQRVAPGEGVIDLQAFFTALKKTGYRAAVSPEIFGFQADPRAPEQGAILVRRAISRLLGPSLKGAGSND